MPHAEHRSQVSQGKWITQVICHLSSHCWAANHLWARSLACCHLLSSESSISMAPWVTHARNIRKQCMNSYISTLNPLRTDIKAQPQVLGNYNPTVLVMISVVTIVCTSGHRTVVWSSGTSIYQLALPKWLSATSVYRPWWSPFCPQCAHSLNSDTPAVAMATHLLWPPSARDCWLICPNL